MPTSTEAHLSTSERELTLEGNEQALRVFRALDSSTRLQILALLSRNSLGVGELAQALSLPLSTVNFNLKLLEEAGLLTVEFVPGTRRSQRLISRRFDSLRVALPGIGLASGAGVIEVAMPVGHYRQVQVSAPCGLALETRYIGRKDDPRSFFEPDHVFAQLLWLAHGTVDYAFPNNLPYGARLEALELSLELCSEAYEHNLDWPSDLTLWVNGVELGTFTCPSDFGGTRGKFTPAWWATEQSQYGLLKVWRVTEAGTFLDGEPLSNVTLRDLPLEERHSLEVKVGIKDDARHRGGLNLFGQRWGNYAQDIVMRLYFQAPPGP